MFRRSAKIEESKEFFVCERCFEGGERRDCCKHVYCQHCYDMDDKCPSCEIPTGKEAAAALAKNAREKIELENEECRKCLAPGQRRECCKEYFCDNCYFEMKFCPSCNTRCIKRVGDGSVEDPGFASVGLSYITSAIISGVVVVLAIIETLNYLQTPETVYGYKCYGFFEKCDINVCIEMNTDPQLGLQNLFDAKYCDLGSINKVRGMMCIYDKEMYLGSEQTMGVDFCEDEFSQGVFVLEDNFEHWTDFTTPNSSLMLSALWDEVNHATVTDGCGGAEGTDLALHFQGAARDRSDARYATTLPLDVLYGGYVSFLLKTGPVTYNTDLSLVTCKPAYFGDLEVQYWIQGNSTEWTTIATYEAKEHRGVYHPLRVEIPPQAWSQETRFRFAQIGFEDERDHIALDNVQVFHRFVPEWRSSEYWADSQDISDESIEEAQCCLDTEQCETAKADQELTLCDDIPGYAGTRYQLKGAAMYVIAAGFVLLCKATYIFFMQGTVKGFRRYLRMGLGVFKYIPLPRCFGRRRKKDGKKAALKKKKRAATKKEFVPEGLCEKFSLHRGHGWQDTRIWFAFCTVLPCFVIPIYTYTKFESAVLYLPLGGRALGDGLREGGSEVEFHTSFIVLLALFLDVYEAYRLARFTICVLPDWVPTIEVDVRPNKSWLKMPEKAIKLEHVRRVQKFDASYARGCFVLYFFGCIPYANFGLFLRTFYLDYDVDRITSKLIGGITLVRAFFGYDFLLTIGHTMRWIFAQSISDRDWLGDAIKQDKVRYMAYWWALCGSALLSVGTAVIVGRQDSAWAFLIWVLGFVGGGVLGALFAFFQGVPCMARNILTSLDTGLSVSYAHVTQCPCLLYCEHCTGLHTHNRVLNLFVEDEVGFQSMLRGNPLQANQ